MGSTFLAKYTVLEEGSAAPKNVFYKCLVLAKTNATMDVELNDPDCDDPTPIVKYNLTLVEGGLVRVEIARSQDSNQLLHLVHCADAEEAQKLIAAFDPAPAAAAAAEALEGTPMDEDEAPADADATAFEVTPVKAKAKPKPKAKATKKTLPPRKQPISAATPPKAAAAPIRRRAPTAPVVKRLFGVDVTRITADTCSILCSNSSDMFFHPPPPAFHYKMHPDGTRTKVKKCTSRRSLQLPLPSLAFLTGNAAPMINQPVPIRVGFLGAVYSACACPRDTSSGRAGRATNLDINFSPDVRNELIKAMRSVRDVTHARLVLTRTNTNKLFDMSFDFKEQAQVRTKAHTA